MENITFEDFIEKVREYNPDEVEIVKKAYELAYNLHKGQFRQSGEAYIMHPLNVAYILSEMHADRDTLCAGLLHDTLEDTNITKEEIAHEFNDDVANLVDGVTKLAKMNFSSKQDESLANTRKIIKGISNDVRIIIIKLADRLHNMRTLQYKSEFKQKENSTETLEIFVPLAYYIGAYRIKNELEDLSFKYLNPDEYRRIEEDREVIEESSKSYLEEMLYNIKSMLDNKNIPNEIKIRIKNIYGIYKSLNTGHTLNDMHDLHALKIMVDEIDNCYITLGIIHKNYHPINNNFKDYICNPKCNMYRSLHTTVFGRKPVQVQIRTFDMDKVASFGLATYWDLNKGDARYKMQKELKEKSQFLKSLDEIDISFKNNMDFVNQVKAELFSDKVYVYTVNGAIYELPKGATPIDLAYKIGDNVGKTMGGATIDGKYVPLNYQLKNYEIVSIISNDLPIYLKQGWENFAHTTYAKNKIIEERKQNVKRLII
ncbi:MAG: RelA/SpoT family protein [Clostridium sp.]|nr:RelA/SpoT family protein [Clostridium sp.]MCM1444495.1 RelA/SpoT family protein [Candidatus Amulumruptor caecigallinarius]